MEKSPRHAFVEPLIIEPGLRNWNYWQDIWRYRELFRVLAWRDIAIRYKQTVIGATWALIRPLIAMLVFTVVFGKIAQLPSPGAPYPLMVLAGLLPWTLFSTSLSDASNSLIGNSNLISKVYFPRIIVPTAAVMVSLVDFLVSLVLLFGLMLWYQYPITWRFSFLPLFLLLAFFASLGPSLFASALNVKYRDFRYVIPFVLQCGLYISPVGFSSSVVPKQWQLAYSLNPLVGIIDGFRWCILGPSSNLSVFDVETSIVVTIVIFCLGVWRFRNLESKFADLI